MAQEILEVLDGSNTLIRVDHATCYARQFPADWTLDEVLARVGWPETPADRNGNVYDELDDLWGWTSVVARLHDDGEIRRAPIEECGGAAAFYLYGFDPRNE